MKKEDERLKAGLSAKGNEDDALEKNNTLIKYKILVDKLGAGFSSIQFLNILFFFTGASFFMIGIVNALKSAINTVTSSIVKRRAERGHFSTDLMILSGIFFGLSFLLVATSVNFGWSWLFAISLLVGSFFFVIHGDMFQIFLDRYLKKLKPGIFTERTTFIGIVVMAVSIFLSALLLEKIPITGVQFKLPIIGLSHYFGYWLSFEIATIAFIMSSYLFMRIKITLVSFNVQDQGYTGGYFSEMRQSARKYFSNKYLLILTLAMIFVGVFQAIMNAFVGIYMYDSYKNVFLGGFLNVGFMLSLALLVVLIGPLITGKMNRNLGVVPLFVFGTLLMAILPLTLYYNAYFPAVVVANLLCVLGAAMIGAGHNLVAVRLLNEKERESYYTFSGIFALIPFAVLVILISFFADKYGLVRLFKYLGFGVVTCLFPIYFVMVMWISKRNNPEKKSI